MMYHTLSQVSDELEERFLVYLRSTDAFQELDERKQKYAESMYIYQARRMVMPGGEVHNADTLARLSDSFTKIETFHKLFFIATNNIVKELHDESESG